VDKIEQVCGTNFKLIFTFRPKEYFAVESMTPPYMGVFFPQGRKVFEKKFEVIHRRVQLSTVFPKLSTGFVE
jgi:hypothetical protein